MRTVSIEVDVDIDDVLDDIGDETIAEEFERRGLFDLSAIRNAIAELTAAKRYDAATRLEREFFPKWKSVDECRAAYEQRGQPRITKPRRAA
jgi:hypothetical protein